MDTDQLIRQLDKVALGRMYQAAQKAQIRLQLYFTGRTHELMLGFSERAQGAILRHGGKDGKLDGIRGYALQSDLLRMWADLMTEWQAEFQQIRREAAWIPFGVLSVVHERMVLPAISREQGAIGEAVNAGVFSPQIRILLEVAGEHLYDDGMTLSARIWKLDQASRDGINQVLLKGIANGDSAFDIAKQLEQYLGANEDCPRWTSSRLYGLTKKDIASGNTAGLLRGEDCDSRGVSYNALRLARTEIQKIHALATDKMMAMQPWVEQEQVHLSPAHAERDICDDVVEGGEDGEGIYEVGTIELPLHPGSCLCFKTAVLMEKEEFTSRLRGWMTGEQPWEDLDTYEQSLGGDASASVMNQAVNLAVWMFSDELKDWLE